MSNGKIPVYLVQMNHFDPIWRRCWDRRFEYGGQIYASYADVEQAVIDDWLKIAEDTEATFVLEQTVSLRKYLERRPEKRDILRKLARDGRFELLAGGEVIPDANMPMGESLVRNMLYGILWAEKTLGVSVTTGCRTDGFGSSAQIPQRNSRAVRTATLHQSVNREPPRTTAQTHPHQQRPAKHQHEPLQTRHPPIGSITPSAPRWHGLSEAQACESRMQCKR